MTEIDRLLKIYTVYEVIIIKDPYGGLMMTFPSECPGIEPIRLPNDWSVHTIYGPDNVVTKICKGDKRIMIYSKRVVQKIKEAYQ